MTNIFTTVRTVDAPYVRGEDRVSVQDIGGGFWRVLVQYGFMETPDVPAALKEAQARGIPWEDDDGETWFLGRDNVVRHFMSPTAGWRIALFAFLARNAQQAFTFYRIPPDRVIEIGAQVDL